MAARLARIVAAPWFTTAVLIVIVVNAVALGLETYSGVEDRMGDLLGVVNDVCLAIFVAELAMRIGAYGRRPWDFFRDGWNVFDFVVIAIAFVPGIRESSTLLRLARLARVVRIVRLFPDLRVLLAGVWRSIPPLFAIALATGMLLFVYGMVGWTLFADELPDDWGNIGRAMLTLFVMLTLENFPTYMDAGMEVHPWSWVYFVSFILIAAFVVINVLIGIVLNSMEEAREAERRKTVRERLGAERPSPVDADASVPVVERIGILRAALDELEAELSVGRTGRAGRVDAAEAISGLLPGLRLGLRSQSASREREARHRPIGLWPALGEQDHLLDPRACRRALGMVELEEVAGRVADVQLRLASREARRSRSRSSSGRGSRAPAPARRSHDVVHLEGEMRIVGGSSGRSKRCTWSAPARSHCTGKPKSGVGSGSSPSTST